MSKEQTETGVRIEFNEYATHYRRDDNCEKHGPFESSSFVPGAYDATRHPTRWTGCPKCSEEREAERERREREETQRRQLEGRIARADIPRRFHDATLDNYIATNAGQRHALEVARGYADNFRGAWECGQSLLLLGNVGTGKTHLAVGIAHKAMEQGFSATFTVAADMIGKVKAKWGHRGGDSETPESVIERFAKVPLLVVDEVGSIKCAGREWEILFAILGSRHNEELPTVFTANLTPAELPGYLGEPIVSRLRESGTEQVIFGWGDYRPIKGKQAMADRSVAL